MTFRVNAATTKRRAESSGDEEERKESSIYIISLKCGIFAISRNIYQARGRE